MNKRFGFALLLGLLVGYPFELSSQPISHEGKKLIQKNLKKSKKDEPTTPSGSALPGWHHTPA